MSYARTISRPVTRRIFYSLNSSSGAQQGEIYARTILSNYSCTQHRSINMSSPAAGIERISTSNSAAPAAPYSQAIKAAGQIWVSGQIHVDASGKKLEASVTERTRLCCQNLQGILEAAGSSIDKVVRVGVFLVDMKDFAEMNEEYKKWFSHKPARSCVAVHQLPFGCTVEIEAIALA